MGNLLPILIAESAGLSRNSHVWKIVDKKLYLNFNPDVGKCWSRDISLNVLRRYRLNTE